MRLVRNFALVFLNLVNELWNGFSFQRPSFYDKYTETKTKIGYAIFILLLLVTTVGAVTWLYLRIYK
ncbi:hypothetical protein MALU111345_18815 [Marinicrinis lubricantis]